MFIPLIGLAIIAVAILRYVIGFTCGRITRELGPFTSGQVALIVVVWGCIAGLYVGLGQFVASVPS